MHYGYELLLRRNAEDFEKTYLEFCSSKYTLDYYQNYRIRVGVFIKRKDSACQKQAVSLPNII